MKTRHGIRVIDGTLFWHDEPEEAPKENLFTITVPPDVLRRGFKLNGDRHYSTDVLYKLQNGRCFYCNEPMTLEHHQGIVNPKGWVKAQLFPRSEGYTMWGNKVLCNTACAKKHKYEMPTELHIAKFRRLYSQETFQAVFEVEREES